MKARSEQLALKLESALGTDAIAVDSASLASHIIDGKRPALVCRPGTPEQVATTLRICADAGAAIIPWGGGTAMGIGNPPREACVVMELGRLDSVIEHDHANLTVTVLAGITPAALHEILSLQRQFLPFDPPFPTKATVGGVVAANMNGPRRGCYGGIRDLVIGMKVALATGEQIKAGGKVVKNVAGYDMCKLFVGSLGSLGVITELTLRVSPIPEIKAVLIASGDLAETARFADALLHSPLLPAAVTLTNKRWRRGVEKRWHLAVWCEGFAASVSRQLSEAEKLARHLSLDAASMNGAGDDEWRDSLWNFPLEADRCVYRATLPRPAVGNFIEAVSQTTASPPLFLGDMIMGTVWLSWPANREAVAMWPQLMALAAAHHGHAVMFSAPHQLKDGLDVWGPPAPTFSLMRKIKDQFDPNGLLNPGRFVAGI